MNSFRENGNNVRNLHREVPRLTLDQNKSGFLNKIEAVTISVSLANLS